MKRYFKVAVLLVVLGLGVPAKAPAAPPSCSTCQTACAAAVAFGIPVQCEKVCTGLCRP